MKSFLVSALICVLVQAALVAQQHIVVPSAYTAANGESRALVPGIMSTCREQLLVGAGHLVVMQGQVIEAIEFRRHAFSEPFGSGSAFLTVSLSTTGADPLATSAVFAVNSGPNEVQVFSGTVAAPASPDPGAAVVPWTANNVVRIALQTPFVYSGGTLCVDIIGTAISGASSSFWTADAAVASSDGSAFDMGPGTGPQANSLGQWSYIRKSELSPGSDVEMSAYGQVNSLCLAVLGRPSAAPIPLNTMGIGAPGAMAYIDEVYQTSLVMLLPPDVPVYAGGIGYWDLWLPNQSWILGADLATQWLDLITWDVSNGIRWTVATAAPTLGMAQVTGSPLDSVGQRTVNVAHIVRFEYTQSGN